MIDLLIIIGKGHLVEVQQSWGLQCSCGYMYHIELNFQSERDCKERNLRCSWWCWIKWTCKIQLKPKKQEVGPDEDYAWNSTVTKVKNKIKLKPILLVLFAKYNYHVQNISTIHSQIIACYWWLSITIACYRFF